MALQSFIAKRGVYQERDNTFALEIIAMNSPCPRAAPSNSDCSQQLFPRQHVVTITYLQSSRGPLYINQIYPHGGLRMYIITLSYNYIGYEMTGLKGEPGEKGNVPSLVLHSSMLISP